MKTILLLIISVFLVACASIAKPQINFPAANANVVLALAYYKAGDVITAEKTLAIAQTEAPQKAFVWYAAAHVYEMQKQVKLADRYFRYAISVEPSSLKAKQNYAVFLCRQRKYKVAMTLFDEVIKNKNDAGLSLALKNRMVCLSQFVP